MLQNAITLLNWSVVAISIFNLIALLWLGLTVLLNAERPRWGTWAVGGGLVLGGLFFTAHTAIVARDIVAAARELAAWWRLVWVPFVAAPYLWYLVMAWHSGALAQRRHRIWLLPVTALGLLALGVAVAGEPVPAYDELRAGHSTPIFSLAGIPVVLLVYPVYSVLCIVLSVGALWQPGASDRFMGDLARRRARPWLLGSSLVLLAVSLAVGATATWALVGVSAGTVDLLAYRTLVALHVADLLVSTLIAVAVVLMGKAIVTYEIFTGKTLPRGGLLRYWRNSLVLAAGYGAALSWSLDQDVDPVYRLMLATVLMTLFYALLSWRSYAERERGMQRLRPFVASQHLYERLVGPLAPAQLDGAIPFHALCADVLDARSAMLVPLGPLAPLVEPLAHATAGPPPAGAALAELAHRLAAPQVMCVPVAPERYAGAVWAVPLWSERGLIGALLLGPKRDDALYTQEEIEVARAAAERLVDTRASAELAHRLVGIQRQRLAESQVVDRRTRRVLHDDVLPQLHTAMILLQSQPGAGESEATAILADAHRRIADLLHALPAGAGGDVAGQGLAEALRAAVARELGGAFDSVRWRVDQEAERRARGLPPHAAEVLFYAAREAIRNAARHGRGADPARALGLEIAMAWDPAAAADPGLSLTVCDDGVGLGAGAPGAGGAGRGLALHGTLLAVVGGALVAERRPEGGTRVRLTLPPQSLVELAGDSAG